jgi:hypothetical protein
VDNATSKATDGFEMVFMGDVEGIDQEGNNSPYLSKARFVLD